MPNKGGFFYLKKATWEYYSQLDLEPYSLLCCIGSWLSKPLLGTSRGLIIANHPHLWLENGSFIFLFFGALPMFSSSLRRFLCCFQDEKDQRIRELTLELYNERQRCKRRCAAYQEQLQMVLKFVDEHSDHLSRSIQDMVQRIRELEDEDLHVSD